MESKKVELTEAESRMVLSGARGGEIEMLVKEHRNSVKHTNRTKPVCHSGARC